MQLTVEKCDGTFEVYLHTKVMGTLGAALSECGAYSPMLVEELAEAVTTFIQRRYVRHAITSDEIHSMIEVVLCDTGHEKATLLLHENRITRQVRRSRTEVLYHNDTYSVLQCPFDEDSIRGLTRPWNKSLIVRDLEGESELPHEVARAVAGLVEEKVLAMGSATVTSSLVRELVANELLAIRMAQRALADRPLERTEAAVIAAELAGCPA